jgi:hypothetical protein
MRFNRDLVQVLPAPYLHTIARIRRRAAIHQRWLDGFIACELLFKVEV